MVRPLPPITAKSGATRFRGYARVFLGVAFIFGVMTTIGMILSFKASTDQGARERATRHAINQTLRDARNSENSSKIPMPKAPPSSDEPAKDIGKKALAGGTEEESPQEF